MRLALFGGTFDPIHRGHLAIAAAAAESFALDRVIFAPTGKQPLKPDAPAALFADRLQMTALACAPDPRFAVSALDAPRPDGTPNYTLSLLQQLRSQHPEAGIFVLTGADSFLTIRQWRHPERLLAEYEWIVVSRPGSSLTETGLEPVQLTPAERDRIHLITTMQEDVSATALRQRLATGDPCLDLIPGPVAAYIQAHRLYGAPPPKAAAARDQAAIRSPPAEPEL
ncbi:MAG: nicotinate-nucleotide adenylyltransferase [Acidobacteriota bacterium]|nr:nicotinate-nucleotide adenylyltransferase [Acidobacteriota bacterium]